MKKEDIITSRLCKMLDVREHLACQERQEIYFDEAKSQNDVEFDLDYFSCRYYKANDGRFTYEVPRCFILQTGEAMFLDCPVRYPLHKNFPTAKRPMAKYSAAKLFHEDQRTSYIPVTEGHKHNYLGLFTWRDYKKGTLNCVSNYLNE